MILVVTQKKQTNKHQDSDMAKKPSMGRQKIKIAKIQKKNHLQVTFSKRRTGLFKKASELCILCGVEIVIVVFSPAGKVFSFGHPNVESIVDRFVTRNTTTNSFSYNLLEAQTNANVRELNLELSQIIENVELERKRGVALDNMRKTNQSCYWWEAPVDELESHELEQLRDGMEELRKNVVEELNKVLSEVRNVSSVFLPNDAGFFGEYEMKPDQIFVGSEVHVDNNFGYCRGFF